MVVVGGWVGGGLPRLPGAGGSGGKGEDLGRYRVRLRSGLPRAGSPGNVAAFLAIETGMYQDSPAM
jgi:hypothetical protein